MIWRERPFSRSDYSEKSPKSPPHSRSLFASSPAFGLEWAVWLWGCPIPSRTDSLNDEPKELNRYR
jgi:hypothetical protein